MKDKQRSNYIEDGNSKSGNLKISASYRNGVDLDSGIYPLSNVEVIRGPKIAIYIRRILHVTQFGNILKPYDFIRIYNSETLAKDFIKISGIQENGDEDIGNNWVDVKITSSSQYTYDSLGTTTVGTKIEGIIESGRFEDITEGSFFRLGFYFDESENLDSETAEISEITNLTDKSLSVNIKNSQDTRYVSVCWRKWKTDNWSYSSIGPWIDNFKIELGGTNYPEPQKQYNGKPSYWIELSEPDIVGGIKPSAWAHVNKGSIISIDVQESGSGYLEIPSYSLYNRKLSDNTYTDCEMGKVYSYDDHINIRIDSHTFVEGDRINIDLLNFPEYSGNYDIKIVDRDNISVKLNNIDKFPNNTSSVMKGTFKLAPIKEPETRSVITPILNRDIYNIQLLESGETYDVGLVTFYDKTLGNYSKITNFISVTTR